MSESTKALNMILRKYNVSAEEVIEMMTQWLERKVCDDYEETLEEYGEKDFERLERLHKDLNELDWNYNFPY
ncbi:hypothetical protein [Bacillus paranthracis]|uniref:hypothetical protein n=1 Tax=Bacillus paranthracis TaxID=2026186 RepID=UPI0005CF905C|nr:hypothetical protein [Bacillus paranthracis]MCU5202039.1 hypothetical protein [Bacillus paranthracis]MED0974059.1 hypothetical protein [Bacillus paranthracis]MED1137173.1 hypothetical protein [Bacillus paranthracis]HDR7485393.1 hypothetical protein [Bacillus pacificus]